MTSNDDLTEATLSAVFCWCDECHYAARLEIGADALNVSVRCLFPSYCEDCRDIVEADLFRAPLACPDCGGERVTPYDDALLGGENGENEVVSWNVKDHLGRVPVLTDGMYLCPECSGFTLRFCADVDGDGLCDDCMAKAN
jgi:DNA-directed RNA polymerase subunit RPC12/RpoP